MTRLAVDDAVVKHSVWRSRYRYPTTPGIITDVTPNWVWLYYPLTNQTRRAKRASFTQRFDCLAATPTGRRETEDGRRRPGVVGGARPHHVAGVAGVAAGEAAG